MLFRFTEQRAIGSATRGAIKIVLFLLLALAYSVTATAAEFSLRQIADERYFNREAVLGETGLIAWMQYNTNDTSKTITDLILYQNGERRNLTEGQGAAFYGNAKPSISSNGIVWIANYLAPPREHFWVLREVPTRDEGTTETPALFKAGVDEAGEQVFFNVADTTGRVEVVTNSVGEVSTNYFAAPGVEDQLRRHPSGTTEINFWPGTGDIVRISGDLRHDFNPSFAGRLISWQKAKGFPFGWEIMVWDDGVRKQLTTNFYYDMAPKVHGRQVVWYGWDGYDFEIFLYDADKDTTTQITSNRYDDVSPVLWDGQIAWEGYSAVEADIYLYRNGETIKISDNIEDDINPRIWNGQVVWQAFDGDDFEIYLYDGSKAIKVTKNDFDDTNPDIRDGMITWMGYKGNWDAEIYAWEGTGEPTQLTDNDEEDRDPRTAGRRIIWTVEREGRSEVWLAEPQ
ncbi:MAG: hypothetical protein H3C50_01070 [Kiritimatiellae bacterium]|nr:hypothetical protein [Kiritimatiellia bacterium]MCO5068243.1 hypothetical protein [Kiritimatiellia bacterium]